MYLYSLILFLLGGKIFYKKIHKTLVSQQRVALSGLGGIGKTQTAAHYAQQHREDYQAVLWVEADSEEILRANFAGLAPVLNVPAYEQQERVIQAVQQWLNKYQDWLLIFDNVEKPSLIDTVVPTNGSGQVLLTTQGKTTPLSIEVPLMELKEAAVFLLRRSGCVKPYVPIDDVQSALSEHYWQDAVQLAQELGCLPLALDQAGAYVMETGQLLADYLKLYQDYATELLAQRGDIAANHPDPVTTTFLLAFKKVENFCPPTADLLRLCAFLHPDEIPEEFFHRKWLN